MTEPIALTLDRAADLVCLSERRLRDLCNAGAIDSRYEGRKRLVLVESLREYMKSLPRERVTS